MKKPFFTGYFTVDGKRLGPDDPIIQCEYHRNDAGVTVVKEVEFHDRFGETWQVLVGDLNNGASIPRIFWRIWTPYSCRIRDASAFHDPYCVNKVRRQSKTHYMYWEMLRTLGVNPTVSLLHWCGIRLWCRLCYWDWK